MYPGSKSVPPGMIDIPNAGIKQTLYRRIRNLDPVKRQISLLIPVSDSPVQFLPGGLNRNRLPGLLASIESYKNLLFLTRLEILLRKVEPQRVLDS